MDAHPHFTRIMIREMAGAVDEAVECKISYGSSDQVFRLATGSPGFSFLLCLIALCDDTTR